MSWRPIFEGLNIYQLSTHSLFKSYMPWPAYVVFFGITTGYNIGREYLIVGGFCNFCQSEFVTLEGVEEYTKKHLKPVKQTVK